MPTPPNPITILTTAPIPPSSLPLDTTLHTIRPDGHPSHPLPANSAPKILYIPSNDAATQTIRFLRAHKQYNSAPLEVAHLVLDCPRPRPRPQVRRSNVWEWLSYLTAALSSVFSGRREHDGMAGQIRRELHDPELLGGGSVVWYVLRERGEVVGWRRGSDGTHPETGEDGAVDGDGYGTGEDVEVRLGFDADADGEGGDWGALRRVVESVRP